MGGDADRGREEGKGQDAPEGQPWCQPLPDLLVDTNDEDHGGQEVYNGDAGEAGHHEKLPLPSGIADEVGQVGPVHLAQDVQQGLGRVVLASDQEQVGQDDLV